MITSKATRHNGMINERGEVTFPQKKEEMICKCGHDLTYHAHSQWRNYWMCDSCDCDDFELAAVLDRKC
jgi:hypothetical protein